MSNAKVTFDPMNHCGAKTRAGGLCCRWPMPNGRCNLHGGKSPGPPLGNKNAWKHGMRSAEQRAFRALLRTMREGLEAFG